jgi:hypothetical protein
LPCVALVAFACSRLLAQAAAQPFDSSLILSQSKDERLAQERPDWTTLETEAMQHYQAVLQLDTRNPQPACFGSESNRAPSMVCESRPM